MNRFVKNYLAGSKASMVGIVRIIEVILTMMASLMFIVFIITNTDGLSSSLGMGSMTFAYLLTLNIPLITYIVISFVWILAFFRAKRQDDDALGLHSSAVASFVGSVMMFLFCLAMVASFIAFLSIVNNQIDYYNSRSGSSYSYYSYYSSDNSYYSEQLDLYHKYQGHIIAGMILSIAGAVCSIITTGARKIFYTSLYRAVNNSQNPVRANAPYAVIKIVNAALRVGILVELFIIMFDGGDMLNASNGLFIAFIVFVILSVIAGIINCFVEAVFAKGFDNPMNNGGAFPTGQPYAPVSTAPVNNTYAPPTTRQQTVPVTQGNYAPPKTVGVSSVVCPNCGAICDGNMSFCVTCGSTLEK